MYYQNKKKNSTIPKEWFFFKPQNLSDNKNLSHLTKKVGVIFFNNTLSVNKFMKKIELCVKFCQKKKIKFIIPYSEFWGNKYRAFGMMVETDRKSQSAHVRKKKYRNYFITAKVHNFKEAFLAKGLADLIFLSPVLKTNSYPEKQPLTNYIFISLCFFFKEEVVFALGGVNYKNFKFMKDKKLHGFGGISCFEKNEKI